MARVLLARREQADPGVAHLPPVAERAVDDRLPPELRSARDVRIDVVPARGEDDGAGGEHRPVLERHAAIGADPGDLSLDQAD